MNSTQRATRLNAKRKKQDTQVIPASIFSLIKDDIKQWGSRDVTSLMRRSYIFGIPVVWLHFSSEIQPDLLSARNNMIRDAENNLS